MDWKSVIGSVAPMLGAAVAGPFGPVAVSLIGDALGLSDKTEGSIKQALSGVTPENMLAIKEAEQGFALSMQKLGFENAQALEALAAGDRDSARKREIAVKDNTPKVLAYLLTLGFFLVLASMMFLQIPTGSRDILNIMLGTLGSSFTGIIAYYFGSSAGSAAKTDLLAKADPIHS